MTVHRSRGFTITELLIAMAVLAVVTAVAVPSYSSYVQRSRVPAGLDALSSFATRMEQLYQDTGSYSVADACGVSLPTAESFTVSCSLSNGGQGYTATATGSGRLSGYTYTINSVGVRATTAHPKGVPSGNCWSIKGGTSDS